MFTHQCWGKSLHVLQDSMILRDRDLYAPRSLQIIYNLVREDAPHNLPVFCMLSIGY
jgi:hypothetical protein